MHFVFRRIGLEALGSNVHHRTRVGVESHPGDVHVHSIFSTALRKHASKMSLMRLRKPGTSSEKPNASVRIPGASAVRPRRGS